jgi:OFA family oxalate/formate antiporter-like MFS transporter
LKNNKSLVVGCFIMMALTFGIIMISIGVFLTPIRMELCYSISDVSLIISLISLGTVFGAQPVSILMESKGIKKIVFFCMFLVSIGIIFFSLSTKLWQFYLCSILIGIGFVGNATMPISLLINSFYHGKNPGLALSIALTGSSFGGAIFNPLLTIIIEVAGWRIAFASIAILYAAVYTFVLLFLIPNTGNTAKVSDTAVEKEGWTFEKAIRSRKLWLIVIAFSLLNATCNIFTSQLVSFLIWTGVTAVSASLVMSISTALMVPGKILMGRSIDKLGINNSTIAGTILLAVGAISLYLTMIFNSAIWIFAVCFACGVPTATVCMPIMVNKYFGDKDYARILGTVTAGFGIGGAVGPFVAGLITHKSDGYDATWLSVFAWTAVAALIIVFVVRKYKPYH